MVHPDNFGPQIWNKFVSALWGEVQGSVKTVWQGYMDEKSKDRRMFDDVGIRPPDLWQPREEMQDLPLDDFGQGFVTHYEMEEFAKRLIVPEAFQIFKTYEPIYDATRMLAYTEKLTEDYYAKAFLDDAFTTANGKIGGDNLAMCSASHVVNGGTTVSNAFTAAGTPPMSPSNTAIGATIVAIEKTPAENGRIDSMLKAKRLIGPSEYRFRFAEIMKSVQKDDTANNAINAIKGEISGDYVSVPLLTSSRNWFMKTNAQAGLTWFWGKKPDFRKVSNEINETTVFLGSAYWTAGWSDYRTMFGHQFD